MGRPKGAVNKITREVKEMILQALENKGGVEYLEKQADANPTAFLTLVGKIIPLAVGGDPNNPLNVVTRVELVPLEGPDQAPA